MSSNLTESSTQSSRLSTSSTSSPSLTMSESITPSQTASIAASLTPSPSISPISSPSSSTPSSSPSQPQSSLQSASLSPSQSSTTQPTTRSTFTPTSTPTSTPTNTPSSTIPSTPSTSASSTQGSSSTTPPSASTTSTSRSSIQSSASTSTNSQSPAVSSTDFDITSPQPSPTTTFSSTVIVTTTDSSGKTTLSTPSFVTKTITTTDNSGVATTITQIGANPTLNANNNTTGSSQGFFHNTGAVVALFVLVGIAIIFVLLWMFIATRRRQLKRRLELDAIVPTSSRSPLEDEDDDPRSAFSSQNIEMSQHAMGPRSSLLMAQKPSGPYKDDGDGYIPFVDVHAASNSAGDYTLVRSGSPTGEISRHGHSASASAGSFEPLLGTSYQSSSPPRAPTPPARSVLRNAGKPVSPPPLFNRNSVGTASVYSVASASDGRLDPGLKPRARPGQSGDAGSVRSDLRDEEDYSRPVLEVRNVSDGDRRPSL